MLFMLAGWSSFSEDLSGKNRNSQGCQLFVTSITWNCVCVGMRRRVMGYKHLQTTEIIGSGKTA
jgi:hypothetical protein